MAEALNVLIVGCGYWGKNYVRIFNELPEARVLALCDKDPDKLEQMNEQFGGFKGYTELSEALEHPGLDAVVVCTVAKTHFAVVSQCLDAGKHVLVEKPMTTDVAHGEALERLAKNKGLTLMVGHTFMYNRSVETLKNLVNLPDFGDLHYLYARRSNLGPIRHDVNALWDLAPHDISIFNDLVGEEPLWVSAVASTLLGEREDVGFINLGYPGGILANIHASWVDPYKVRELVAVGSRQRLVFDDMNKDEPLQLTNRGVAKGKDGSPDITEGDTQAPAVEPKEPLKAQSQHFITCVRNGAQPLTDAAAGLSVVRVMVAVDESVAKNGQPVMLAAVPA